jgi:hypothetical protein
MITFYPGLGAGHLIIVRQNTQNTRTSRELLRGSRKGEEWL